MSTNWPNDRINDLPDHNPPTQEFIQDQGSFDIRYPSPNEWLDPSSPPPTRPYPAARPGPQFTNRQLLIIGAAVATVIVVLCGSLVAIGALSNHTTPTAKNPTSAASAAATATASATLAAGDNSGLPTTLPTFQPAATTAPGQPTPTTSTTGTKSPNPTNTPFPTATSTGGTGSFTDDLNFWGTRVVHSGLRIVSNPQDNGCAAPTRTGGASDTFIEWQQNNVTTLVAVGYISGSNPSNPPSAFAAFTFSTSADGNNFITWVPSSVTTGSTSGGWTQYTYTVKVAGSPRFVRVSWNTVTSQNGNPPPELGQMTIDFQQ